MKYSMRWFHFLIIGLAISVSFMTQAADVSSPFYIHHREVPQNFKDAYDFLELIKYPREPQGVYNIKATPQWNVQKFMSFISKQGVDFSDANDNSKHHFSFSQLKSQLTNRNGKGYSTF